MRGIAVVAKPILTPLKDVTAHVIDSQFVRRLGTHEMGRVVGIAAIPGHLADVVAAGILVTVALDTAASGIFPLGLGGQAVFLAGLFVEAGDEFLALRPGHALDGKIQVTGEGARVVAHDLAPQALGHLDVGHHEAVNGHRVSRALVGVGVGALLAGRAHGE